MRSVLRDISTYYDRQKKLRTQAEFEQTNFRRSTGKSVCEVAIFWREATDEPQRAQAFALNRAKETLLCLIHQTFHFSIKASGRNLS